MTDPPAAPQSTPQAGWYPSEQKGFLRWWNGNAWTDDYRKGRWEKNQPLLPTDSQPPSTGLIVFAWVTLVLLGPLSIILAILLARKQNKTSRINGIVILCIWGLIAVAIGVAVMASEIDSSSGDSADVTGLTPASSDWEECVSRFGAKSCREGVGSYPGGPLGDDGSGGSSEQPDTVQRGEYTCFRSVLSEVDEADAVAEDARATLVVARRRARATNRRIKSLNRKLAALETDQTAAGIETYNATVDEFNAFRQTHNRAVSRENRAVDRYNRLARRYNRILDDECVKD